MYEKKKKSNQTLKKKALLKLLVIFCYSVMKSYFGKTELSKDSVLNVCKSHNVEFEKMAFEIVALNGKSGLSFC